MGLLDKVQDKFAETLINKIIDNKRIIITAEFVDKQNIESGDSIAKHIINNKKVIASVEFEDK